MEPKDYTVFVVDDEINTAEIMAASISALSGYNIKSFTDPNIALQTFIKHPADLVITDLNMPNIDGFEMIQRLKDRNLNTDFMIITGEKNVKTVVHARWLGVGYLFFKPVNMDDVLEAVETMFRRVNYWENKLKEVQIKK